MTFHVIKVNIRVLTHFQACILISNQFDGAIEHVVLPFEKNKCNESEKLNQ
jgi:hypothetical protein